MIPFEERDRNQKERKNKQGRKAWRPTGGADRSKKNGKKPKQKKNKRMEFEVTTRENQTYERKRMEGIKPTQEKPKERDGGRWTHERCGRSRGYPKCSGRSTICSVCPTCGRSSTSIQTTRLRTRFLIGRPGKRSSMTTAPIRRQYRWSLQRAGRRSGGSPCSSRGRWNRTGLGCRPRNTTKSRG